MNQKDDDKATASLLLSTDEAVAEKIRRVLTNHPEIVAEAMKRVEEHLLIQRQQAEYQRALQQSMMQNQARQQIHNVYSTSNTSGQIAGDKLGRYPWSKT